MLRYQSFYHQLPGHFATFIRLGWLENTCLITGYKQSSFAWATVFMLLLQAHSSQAQSGQLTQQTAAEVDSSRGYWRLNTQAASRTTLIQFFGPNHQLLYVENLPEKWVRLSRKNQKQFDQLLEQLLVNQLVASRIKTEILPPTPALPTAPNVAVRANGPQNSSVATYRVHAYVNPSGKLYLVVDNPDRLRYKISVVDQGNQSLYEEFTSHDQYRRRLDLSSLSQDTYRVIVQIDNKPFIYNIKRQNARFTYNIQPDSVGRNVVADSQNQAEKKPLLMPAGVDL